MAPIPEDNQDKPNGGNKDDSEIGNFSNPNLVMPIGESDSSDNEDSEDSSNIGAPPGYSLLPQDPRDYDEDDDDSDAENTNNIDSAHNGHHIPLSATGDSTAMDGEGIPADSLPGTVLTSEAGASAPTVTASTESCHPSFLAKFPDGKIPSYMQVPSVPRDKDGHLWNQQRQDTHKLPLDPAQESKILRAMSGFTLPSESIPDWAKNLPDDQWQQQILRRIGTSSGRAKHHSSHAVEQHTQSHESGCNNETKETTSTSSSDNSWVADFPDADNSQQ